MDKRAQFLSTIPVFKALDGADLIALGQCFEEKSFWEGETIIQEGDASDGLFLIESGYVNVFRAGESQRIFLSTLGTTELFGEAALFSDHRRTATLEAKDKVVALYATRDKMMDYFKAHPKAGCAILHEFLRRVFIKLERTSSELRTKRDSGLTQEAIDRLLA